MPQIGPGTMTYCTCGELLLLAVEETTVVLPSGERVPFRRTTDFVTCDRCLASFPIEEIRRGAAPLARDDPAASPWATDG